MDDSQKASSTPLNPKSKGRTKEKKIGYKNNTVCLVKREESRNFDVFFGCFLCVCFLCLEEQKMRRKILGREQDSENMVSSRSEGFLGLFIAQT